MADEKKNVYPKKRFTEFEPTLCRVHMVKVRDKVTKEVTEVETQPTFKGRIVLRRPKFDERYEFVEQIGISIDKEGEVQMEQQELKMLRRMVAESEKYYELVELERLSDGEKFENFEDLSVDIDANEILIEVATFMMHGRKVSKN